MPSTKTLFFLGATGGCGFSALRRSLAAGHTCIALCRTPSKLTDKLSAAEQGNLRVEEGNATDVDAVVRCLANPSNPSALVDTIVFSVGGAFSVSRLTNDQPTVCQESMRTLLSALTKARSEWALAGSPRLLAISTTGISEHGRDFPLALIPLYEYMLKDPHKDKKAMEEALFASNESWTIIRPSLLLDPEDRKPKVKTIKVGVEDPKTHKLESKMVGYAISREDVGRWIFESLVQEQDAKWVQKIASITH